MAVQIGPDFESGAGGWNAAAGGACSALRVGDDLDRLHTELGLVDAQAGPWLGFVAAMRANAERLDADPEPDNGHDDAGMPSTLDHLDQLFGTVEQRLAALSMMRVAAARLYAVLNPRQQQTADRLLPLCCLAELAASATGGQIRASSFN